MLLNYQPVRFTKMRFFNIETYVLGDTDGANYGNVQRGVREIVKNNVNEIVENPLEIIIRNILEDQLDISSF